MINRAISIAKHYHKGQMYGDKDYFYHLEQVVSILKYKLDISEDKYIITAYLHDILEDTDCKIDFLRDIFGNEVALAIQVLTKHKNCDYVEYIKSIKLNELALVVKRADTYSNLENSFIASDTRRIKKYSTQLHLLYS